MAECSGETARYPAVKGSLLRSRWGRGVAAVWVALAPGWVGASVRLNEVMYHPPGDRDDLQYVELINTGSSPVSLAGWRITQGVKAELGAVTLPPGGLGVVCRDQKALLAHYGAEVTILGTFSGRLKHGGEQLQLLRPDQSVADEVTFDDRAPWPLSADGEGASLERRVPLAPGTDPDQWGGSALPRTLVAAGSPGRTNSNAALAPLPQVIRVEHSPVIPDQPVTVTAEVGSAAGIQKVSVAWQAFADSPRLVERELVLSRITGDAHRGTYRGELPAPPAGHLLRWRVRAVDTSNSVRWLPDPQDLRPTFSAYVGVNTNRSALPEVRLLSWGAKERPGSSLHSRGGEGRPEPVRGISTFVVMPTNGGPILTFDHIRLTPRQDGWKVRLHKDAPYSEMTTLNVVGGGRPRWLLTEPLGYELFRQAGVATPLAGHLRVWFDQRPIGYCLYVEQPNSSFFRRVKRDPDGSVYKLIWYGQGLEGQHEKKNRLTEGHEDLKAVVEGLRKSRGDAQWEFIQQQFRVPEMASYFAASQCVQNWDGFFNNYFVYRSPGKAGRWEMIPWDLDKTWGDYDGASAQYDWYTMPLTYGMTGDKEPARWFAQRTHNWGSVEWWRPGGWFSGPILANPGFRPVFLKRLKELCQTEFTEERMGAAIGRLQQTLEPEVVWKATMTGQDVRSAGSEFRDDIASLQRQLKERRAFLLKELGK